MNFLDNLNNKIEYVNSYLKKALKIGENNVSAPMSCSNVNSIKYYEILYEAIEYSLLAGGKRIRPVLTLAVADIFDIKYENVINFAAAIEMIHTYSLIHDDLPGMDNDDYRRGRLTNHKKYNEAIAILSGDALLTYAFELCTFSSLEPLVILNIISLLAKCAGKDGMVAGQTIDIISENSKIDDSKLICMHSKKTAALIRASVLIGGLAAGADNLQLEALDSFALNLGLAFQIKDDILDVEGNSEKLGKNTGMDSELDKSTFISIYGLEKSKEICNYHTEKAVNSLEMFRGRNRFLMELSSYLLNREF